MRSLPINTAHPIFLGYKIENEMRWAGHVAHIGESRGVQRVVVWKPEGKRPLGKQRHRWEGNIKTNVREVGYACMDWIELTQDKER